VFNLHLKQKAFRSFERQSKQKARLARDFQRLGCVETIRLSFLETNGSEFMERMKKSLELEYLTEYGG
jgi:hypothetical protein